ncbi:MAG: hypothetical protein KFB96_24835 [Thiocapsa sp.]|nr:MAG: hypothetical protein KFB96_24835 [Thiocapsa sp.]
MIHGQSDIFREHGVPRSDRTLVFLSKVFDALVILSVLAVAIAVYDVHEWNIRYTNAVLAAVILFVMIGEIAGIYRPWRGETATRQFFQILFVWMQTLLVLLLLAYMFKDTSSFSRVATGAWVLATPVLLSGWRILARRIFQYAISQKHLQRNALVWGNDESGEQLARTIEQSPWLGLGCSIPRSFPSKPSCRFHVELRRLERLSSPGQHGVAEMRFDPVLDIQGTHRGHRLVNERARQIGEEGGNRQHQPADLLEGAACGEGFVFPEHRFDDVGGRQPGCAGRDLGGLYLDLFQDPVGKAGGSRSERGARSECGLKRCADAGVQSLGLENALDGLGLFHHLRIDRQIFAIGTRPSEALQEAGAAGVGEIPKGVVQIRELQVGRRLNGLAEGCLVGMPMAQQHVQGTHAGDAQTVAQVVPGGDRQNAGGPNGTEISPLLVGEQVLRPLDMGVDVHEARLGALTRRQQKGQVGLLKGRQGPLAVRQKGLPARVGLQFGLEQGGDAVRNIIGFHTVCRLFPAKQRDPLVQVAAVIGDDLHRHTGALGDLAQHRGDPLPGAVRRHLHGEHLHGPVRRAVAGLEQPGGGDAQNHETLRCAQFKRMIGDVNPVLAPLRRLQEDRQSAAINPVEDRRMRRQAHRHPGREQTQYAGHPAAAESGTQKHLQRQLNDQERMPVTGRGQAQLLPSRSVRLLRRADRCRLRRRRRATALRRQRPVFQ